MDDFRANASESIRVAKVMLRGALAALEQPHIYLADAQMALDDAIDASSKLASACRSLGFLAENQRFVGGS
jgi:hypothetical protein